MLKSVSSCVASAAGKAGEHASRAAPLLLCALLAACSSTLEGPLLFSDPGKYQYHTCDQLTLAARNQSAREQELKRLMDKADEGAAGPVVSAIAYRAEYMAVGEDLRVIESTARGKNCLTPSTWQSNTVIR
jgi:hypothetical protein